MRRCAKGLLAAENHVDNPKLLTGYDSDDVLGKINNISQESIRFPGKFYTCRDSFEIPVSVKMYLIKLSFSYMFKILPWSVAHVIVGESSPLFG